MNFSKEDAIRLKQMIDQGKMVDMASMKWINFQHIADSAGDRWPALESRVREVAKRVLNKHVGTDAIIIGTKDGVAVISVTSDTNIRQWIKSADDEIHRFFLGDEYLSNLKSKVAVNRVHPRSIVGGGPASSSLSNENSRSSPDVQSADQTRVRGNAKETNSWIPLQRNTKTDTRPSNSTNSLDTSAERWRCIYKAIWSPQQSIICDNLVLPQKQIGGSKIRQRSVLENENDFAEIREVDMAVLKSAVSSFMANFRQGMRIPHSVSIDESTLNNMKGQMAMFSEIRGIPKEFRRYFLIDINFGTEIPSESEIREVFSIISNMGLRAGLCLNKVMIKHWRICPSPVSWLSVDRNHLFQGSSILGKQADRVQELFDSSSNTLRTKVFVEPRSQEEVAKLCALGFSHFAGGIIGSQGGLCYEPKKWSFN